MSNATDQFQTPVDTETGNYFVSNYPPYSQWQSQQVPAFEESLQQAGNRGKLGLYVHVPFCRQRCTYCYFRVHVRQAADYMDRYLQAVLREAELYRQCPAIGNRPLANVYFGGGTPSLLSESQIETLLVGLRARLNWTGDAMEVTYECQPGTLSPEKLGLLARLGVNRASIGVQSLTDDVLRNMGRLASSEDCRQSYAMARKVGFEQVNLDLIAGLPGETESSWLATIDQAAALQPDSLTIYQLELTHNSVMNRLMRSGHSARLPTWPAKRHWVALAFERLQQAGYTIISAYWAVRNPERHRFAYVTEHFWRGRDLLALGETSFGYIDGFHYQNVDDLDSYLTTVESGKLPLSRSYRLSAEEAMRREAILQLKTGCLDLAYFQHNFGVDLREHFAEQLHELIDLKLATIDHCAIRLTTQGLLRVDWLLPRFYLPQHSGVRYT